MPAGRTKHRLPGRRQLLGGVIAGAGLAAIGATRARHELRGPTDARALRPPGAVAERRFLAACVRCGLCVRGCPWAVLRLAGEGETMAAGTPYFHAREAACVMCQDLPCQRICPTGALGPAAMRIEQARIGLDRARELLQLHRGGRMQELCTSLPAGRSRDHDAARRNAAGRPLHADGRCHRVHGLRIVRAGLHRGTAGDHGDGDPRWPTPPRNLTVPRAGRAG